MKTISSFSCRFLITLLAFGLTGSAFAEIKLAHVIDASLSVSSAAYDPDYVTEETQSVNPDDRSTAENIYLYFAPNVRFTEIPGLWITPAVEFEYNGANNILQIDDEAFIFARGYNLYYLLGANYRFNQTWQAKLKGFGRLERSAETSDETLENGIYNYSDAGAWGEVNARYKLGVPMRSKLGYKAYMRRYPNYSVNWRQEFIDEGGDTLTAQALPDDLDEKDINVTEVWLRQEMTWGTFPLLTNIEFHVKNVFYTEMPKYEPDGTFSNELREDIYADIILEIPYMINKFHQIEFDYSYRLHYTATGYYDTSQSAFLDGYYNYRENKPRLLYNFKFWFPITGFAPRGSVSFGWRNRYYYSRPSYQQTGSGENTVTEYKWDDPHWESSLDFGITLRQQLFAEWFNLFLSFHAISQTSNSTVEDNATYNYKYNTVTLGTAVSF